jgi:hypothetical protein
VKAPCQVEHSKSKIQRELGLAKLEEVTVLTGRHMQTPAHASAA